MDTTVLKDILIGLIRYALMTIFGILLAKGYVSEDQLTKAAPILAVVVITIGTMIFRKLKTRYRILAALRMSPDSTIEDVKEQAKSDSPLPNIVS